MIMLFTFLYFVLFCVVQGIDKCIELTF